MNYISQTVQQLVKKYSTREPIELCNALNIEVCYMDLGSLKGFYTVMLRNKFIVVNENLDENLRKLVIAHELGHDRLHSELAKNKTLQETVFFDMKSKPEYEANYFAAELLIDEKEVVEYAKNGYTAENIASILNIDYNLLLIKLNIMSQNDNKINQQYLPKSDFLGAN